MTQLFFSQFLSMKQSLAIFVGIFKKGEAVKMLARLEEQCAKDLMTLENIKSTEYIALFRISGEIYDCYHLEGLLNYFVNMPVDKRTTLPQTQVQITIADMKRIMLLGDIHLSEEGPYMLHDASSTARPPTHNLSGARTITHAGTARKSGPRTR